jgi:hypothetical protein
MLTPSLPHMHFFYFSDTCYLGSSGFTKFLESNVVFESLLTPTLNLTIVLNAGIVHKGTPFFGFSIFTA